MARANMAPLDPAVTPDEAVSCVPALFVNVAGVRVTRNWFNSTLDSTPVCCAFSTNVSAEVVLWNDCAKLGYAAGSW